MAGPASISLARERSNRWRHHTRLACILALLLAGLGCGPASPTATPAPVTPAVAAPPTPLPDQLFFIPGEAMYFDFKFRGVLVGNAAISVGHPGTHQGSSRAIGVISRIETTGLGQVVKVVRDRVMTYIDLEQGRTMQQRAELLFGDKDLLVEQDFVERNGERNVDISMTRRGPGFDGPRARFARLSRRYRLPKGQYAHDAIGVLGALRAWEGTPGTTLYFFAVSGSRMWYIELTCDAQEIIDTVKGAYPTLRFQGHAERLTGRMIVDDKRPARRFTMWISEDANRLPLRIEASTEYGDVTMEMTRFDKPGLFH